MKRSVLLFILLSAATGKTWGYGLPAISAGVLTETPIPIPHLTDTPTKTATFTTTVTFTATPTATATSAISIPTVTETITLPNFTPAVSPADSRPNHSQTLDPSQLGLNSFREQGFFELGLGADFPVQGSAVPGAAAGLKGALGLLFKDGFAVQLDLEYFTQSNPGPKGTLSVNEILVLPTLRRYLLAGNVRPYLSMGDGLAINSASSELVSSSVASFDLALGGGVEFVFENYFSTFVEGKYNFVFMSASPSQDIPVILGARLGL